MFVCKICGTEVHPGQAFCPTCGADVVENHQSICPICGAKNVAGSRYCAGCGGLLGVMRKPVCSICGAKNMPGAQFCVSCGAPLVCTTETHSDKDMLAARKAKMKVDAMQRERMAAVDKEIAQKRMLAEEAREQAMLEVEQYRAKCETDYNEKVETLEAYRAKLNEFGSEDVDALKRMSAALKDYSKYYADPYSQVDEDDIEESTYVCPACGTINPLTATACVGCGRNKARALLLLAKKKIKQSPPIKRKVRVIPPPEEELEGQKMPTLEEFAAQRKQPEQPQAEQKQEQADFSGPANAPYYGGYPYPYPPYPMYPPYIAPKMSEQDENGEQKSMQMPPIVQPVAFVPYVTQEQPLVQYMPSQTRERPNKRQG